MATEDTEITEERRGIGSKQTRPESATDSNLPAPFPFSFFSVFSVPSVATLLSSLFFRFFRLQVCALSFADNPPSESTRQALYHAPANPDRGSVNACSPQRLRGHREEDAKQKNRLNRGGRRGRRGNRLGAGGWRPQGCTAQHGPRVTGHEPQSSGTDSHGCNAGCAVPARRLDSRGDAKAQRARHRRYERCGMRRVGS